ALLFYAAVFCMVHMQANKIGLKTENSVIGDGMKDILRRLHLLLPLVVLIYFIFSCASFQRAASWSILTVIIVGFFDKESRFKLTDIIDCLVEGSKQALQVAIPCAVAGIVVGVITHTGLGLKFTSIIVAWSFGNIFLSVILVALS